VVDAFDAADGRQRSPGKGKGWQAWSIDRWRTAPPEPEQRDGLQRAQ